MMDDSIRTTQQRNGAENNNAWINSIDNGRESESGLSR
jgi:hypothetical protein